MNDFPVGASPYSHFAFKDKAESWGERVSATRFRKVVVLLSAVLLVQGIAALDTSLSASSSTVSGTVFVDNNSDGSKGASEVGVAGVGVRAFDSAGSAVGTATTTSDGSYSLTVSGAASTSVRIEFTTPNGYQSSFAASTGGTSIQFVTVPATDVNYSMIVPDNYCADNNANPLLATGCMRPGGINADATREQVTNLLSVGTTSFMTRPAFTKQLTFKQTGAIWGMANQSSTGLVWTSAVIRRHSGLGPLGIGGVYVWHPSTGYVTGFDLSSYITLSADNTQFTDAARGIIPTSILSLDASGYNAVGQAGIGDIEFSDDGLTLYVMNLYDRKIYAFPVGGSVTAPTLGTPTAITVTNPSCSSASDVRAWGINAVGSQLQVGVVCSNETASATAFTAASPSGATTRPGAGYIRLYDTVTSTWSTAATINFDYARGSELGCDSGMAGTEPKCEIVRWHAWTNNYAAIRAAITAGILNEANSKPSYSQPIVSGIDTLEDGSFVVGLADRFNLQMGANNLQPNDTSSSLPYMSNYVSGDTLLLCKTGTSTWTQESDGTCGSRTGVAKTAARLSYDAGKREFFYDQICSTGENDNSHTEISQGAVVVWPRTGTQQVAISAMDPWCNWFEGGVRFLKASDGTTSGTTATYGREIHGYYADGISGGTAVYSFGKSAGMADLEVICNQAPVQIGNRVWIDTDKDGVQDANETPVAGVTVRLYAANGTTLLGTAVTNTKGEYYFASNVTEAVAGTGDHVGGGLAVGVAHIIRFDNATDYAVGGPLYEYLLTTATSSAAETSFDTAVDSNATTVLAYPQITTAVVLPGINDHTYDVGFYLPPPPPPPTPVGMGNFVWIDSDKDGIQDASEKPIKGVVVSLFNADGSQAKDLTGAPATATTDANGYYFIDNLAAGSYYAKFTLPASYTFTTKSATGSTVANDSNPDVSTGITPVFTIAASTSGDSVAESDTSTKAVFVNPTIDAGVIPKGTVSVGDLVWRDRNGNGQQGPGDHGVKGAILRLFNSDGSAVIDAFGRVVKPQTTGKDGKYLFKDLLPGKYIVKISYPTNWYPTTKNGPRRDRNSSTISATSLMLSAGRSDKTLDFGVVYRPQRFAPSMLPATR